MRSICFEKEVLVISLALFACILGACGRKHVQGIVKDPFGNAIDSVSVQVVKSTFSTLTSKNGEYSVDYVPGTFVMKFSKPGYTTQNMELTIQQKMRFPADTVVMYPIPKSQGIFFIGEKALIELQPARVASSQMQISWMSMRYSYSASGSGNLTVKPGRLRFIDKISRSIKLARLGNNNLIQEFDTELGRKFTYNGVIENEDKEEIGEEKLLIRTVMVEPGSYSWVELAQSFMGFRPNENSPCFTFQVKAGIDIDIAGYAAGSLSWFEDDAHVESAHHGLVAFRRCSGDRDKPTCVLLIADLARSRDPRVVAPELVREIGNQYPVAFSSIGLLFAIYSDIYSYDLDRHSITIVAEDAWNLGLSADGNMLAYLTSYGNGGTNVQLLDLQTGHIKQITNFQDKNPGGLGIRWLPGSDILVFELRDNRTYDIETWSVRADGEELRKVADGQVYDLSSIR